MRTGVLPIASMCSNLTLSLLNFSPVNPVDDPLADPIRDGCVQKLRFTRAALADQVIVHPLSYDPPQLPEQVDLRLLVTITEMLEDELLRQVVDDARPPHVLQMIQRQFHAFADYALDHSLSWSNKIRC